MAPIKSTPARRRENLALDVKEEKEDEGREGNVICIHQQEGESRASSPEGSIAKPKPKRNRIPESYARQRSRGPTSGSCIGCSAPSPSSDS